MVAIVIGPPRAYLSGLLGARSRWYPISGIQFELFVIALEICISNRPHTLPSCDFGITRVILLELQLLIN